MADSDQHLVQQTLAGDPDAFAALVTRYAALVHGVIYEMVRQHDEVEDISQDAFCTAYEHLPGLRKQNQFAAWLCRIAVNTAFNTLRSKELQRRVQFDERVRAEVAEKTLPLTSLARNSLDNIEREEIQVVLWESLDRLKPEYRTALVLFHIEGCSYKEIAKFLDVRRTTVKARLYKAKKALRGEVEEILFREGRVPGVNEPSLRKKVLGALPFTPLLAIRPARASVASAHQNWIRRNLFPIGITGLIGVTGYLAYKSDAAEHGDSVLKEMPPGLSVRRGAFDLPDLSVTWDPRRPKAGEAVRVTVAGLESADGDETAELHFITDPTYPVDEVVMLKRQGDAWQGTVTIPLDAKAIFFHVTSEEVGSQQMFFNVSYRTTEKRLRQYRHSFRVYGEGGKPVRSAVQKQAKMAERTRGKREEILALLDHEFRNYPDNFSAYAQRWRVLRDLPGETDWSDEITLTELAVLRSRFPDRPDLLWWAARAPGTNRQELYRQIAEGFPEYERRDESAYLLTREFLSSEEYGRAIAEVRRFVNDYPSSRYLDEAYKRLLLLLVRENQAEAMALADSLVEGLTAVRYVPASEDGQLLNMHGIGGSLPLSMAYSAKFELLSKQGLYDEADEIVVKLIESGVQDPLPYQYVGQHLSGQESYSWLYEDPPSYRINRSLAIRAFEAGVRWTEPEIVLELPAYQDLDARIPASFREEDQRMKLEQANSLRRRYVKAMGQCLIDLEWHNDAINTLVPLASGDEDLPRSRVPVVDQEIQLMLGDAYAEVGDWERAEGAYLNAVKGAYGHSRAEGALRELHEERYGHLANLTAMLATCYDAAPEFRLTGVDGAVISNASLSGRPVLLMYEHPHTEEQFIGRIETLDSLKSVYEEGGVEVVYVNRSGDFLDKTPRGFVHVAMDDDAVGDKLGTRTTTVFVIDGSGRMRLKRECMGGPPIQEKRVEEALSSVAPRKIEELIEERADDRVAVGKSH